MRLHLVLVLLLLVLGAPTPGWADPPPHAPAHGYRNKHKRVHHPSGVELVLDAERGFYVVVGLPDVFFEDGKFYRYHEGGWQVSLRSDSGWTLAVASGVPRAIYHTHPVTKVKHKKK